MRYQTFSVQRSFTGREKLICSANVVNFALLLSLCCQDVWQYLGHALRDVGALTAGPVSLQGSFPCSPGQGQQSFSPRRIWWIYWVGVQIWLINESPAQQTTEIHSCPAEHFHECLTEETESQQSCSGAEQAQLGTGTWREVRKPWNVRSVQSKPGSSEFAAQQWGHSGILRECSASALTQPSLVPFCFQNFNNS